MLDGCAIERGIFRQEKSHFWVTQSRTQSELLTVSCSPLTVSLLARHMTTRFCLCLAVHARVFPWLPVSCTKCRHFVLLVFINPTTLFPISTSSSRFFTTNPSNITSHCPPIILLSVLRKINILSSFLFSFYAFILQRSLKNEMGFIGARIRIFCLFHVNRS